MRWIQFMSAAMVGAIFSGVCGDAATADDGQRASPSQANSPARQSAAHQIPVNAAIDAEGFLASSADAIKLRKQRRIPIAAFMKMAADPDTIVLDTRSASAYKKIHLRGARHLNFSDFAEQKLAKLIPSKQTRILIYCNNNFKQPKSEALVMKAPRFALNLPTFINLHGYGYTNIYELADLLPMDDPRLKFEGTEIEESKQTEPLRQSL